MTTDVSKYVSTTPCTRNPAGNACGTIVPATLKPYAAPTPSAISVNMFEWRVTIELHPRTKNGQPAHSTTGVLKINPIQLVTDMSSRPPSPMPSAMSPIVSANTGIPSAAAIQKRRVMSTSSGFGVSSASTVRGSSAIPQMGHGPGWSRTISGCIGHVYSADALTGFGADDARNDSGSALKRVRQLSWQK